ncbi:ENTH-domain-containing protein [Exidia glandulosa HHB12029]|uniref:ENTH-domain-containing protein n=1 Tax=Exidia glandulosa HHB12029 TaxID=1314781 RepID=A0A165BWE6_EXIGL|nr:ENTH-domain-containing protein [Exidia glandulosa HHB12029]
MDMLENLGKQLSQVTMYDVKSVYNQVRARHAKNIVLNVSEMEAKVREATNDDPWGASSTLMNEIAQGTFNYQQFNEIMPCIYARFMEKEARQWRQIYKARSHPIFSPLIQALQLLEFLIKNGSERTVDDARAHLSTIKMLRNFHYIDDKGKDQGINGAFASPPFRSCRSRRRREPVPVRPSRPSAGFCQRRAGTPCRVYRWLRQ